MMERTVRDEPERHGSSYGARAAPTHEWATGDDLARVAPWVVR